MLLNNSFHNQGSEINKNEKDTRRNILRKIDVLVLNALYTYIHIY